MGRRRRAVTPPPRPPRDVHVRRHVRSHSSGRMTASVTGHHAGRSAPVRLLGVAVHPAMVSGVQRRTNETKANRVSLPLVPEEERENAHVNGQSGNSVRAAAGSSSFLQMAQMNHGPLFTKWGAKGASGHQREAAPPLHVSVDALTEMIAYPMWKPMQLTEPAASSEALLPTSPRPVHIAPRPSAPKRKPASILDMGADESVDISAGPPAMRGHPPLLQTHVATSTSLMGVDEAWADAMSLPPGSSSFLLQASASPDRALDADMAAYLQDFGGLGSPDPRAISTTSAQVVKRRDSAPLPQHTLLSDLWEDRSSPSFGTPSAGGRFPRGSPHSMSTAGGSSVPRPSFAKDDIDFVRRTSVTAQQREVEKANRQRRTVAFSQFLTVYRTYRDSLSTASGNSSGQRTPEVAFPPPATSSSARVSSAAVKGTKGPSSSSSAAPHSRHPRFTAETRLMPLAKVSSHELGGLSRRASTGNTLLLPPQDHHRSRTRSLRTTSSAGNSPIEDDERVRLSVNGATSTMQALRQRIYSVTQSRALSTTVTASDVHTEYSSILDPHTNWGQLREPSAERRRRASTSAGNSQQSQSQSHSSSTSTSEEQCVPRSQKDLWRQYTRTRRQKDHRPSPSVNKRHTAALEELDLDMDMPDVDVDHGAVHQSKPLVACCVVS